MILRSIAAQILALVINDGVSLTKTLTLKLPKLKESQDKAFVQALCYGVTRHYFELDFMLKQLLSKPLKPKDADIQALLLLGLYQLLYMRVKPHAAVSETVAATKHKPWAKALVNAVLRQFLRDTESLKQACAADRQAHYNHPLWMLNAIQENWPVEAEQIFVANLEAPPLALRVNLRQGSRDDYLKLLDEKGIDAVAVEFCDTALILDQAIGVDQIPEFISGRVSVQDVAAQLAAELLDAQAGQWVLDLCAAPGGKTAAILERQPALEGLLAIDIDAERLQRVNDNLQRLGLSADTLVADAAQVDNWSEGRQFQRILLDAPCSGLGVIRRHPDIKLLRRDTDIVALQSLQSQILHTAWQLLEPGGILLYATCSILKAENEHQMANFLAMHNDAYEIPLNVSWGQARPYGRQIFSGGAQMDGFYYAKLCKTT